MDIHGHWDRLFNGYKEHISSLNLNKFYKGYNGYHSSLNLYKFYKEYKEHVSFLNINKQLRPAMALFLFFFFDKGFPGKDPSGRLERVNGFSYTISATVYKLNNKI